jgi:chemotaxis protein methyltransferase CheR
MKDDRCVRFLQCALPQMHMRWPGFRKVRRQVCKRVDRRMKVLGLTHIHEYQNFLETHADEWATLDSLCRITISRFSRDTGVFATLVDIVLPELIRSISARGGDTLRAWSVGCASGEEPYTLAILWQTELQPRFPGMKLDVTATDSDTQILKRASEARYAFGSLKELPAELRDRVFTRQDDTYHLHADYKCDVTFLEQDVREAQPDGRFDLVLCRNLVFTYFDDKLQAELLSRIIDSMADGAALVIGIHENLPENLSETTEQLEPWFDKQRIYRKTTSRHKL